MAEVDGNNRMNWRVPMGTRLAQTQVPINDVIARRGGRGGCAALQPGAAGQTLHLQATALGLMAHPMGGYDPGKARAAFAIPDAYTPMAMIAVGHPGPAESLEDEYREQETAARVRKPLSE